MSLGLQATKRRISSVNNTKKITNAMKLVATSKLRVWKNKLSGNSTYADSLHRLMGVLCFSLDDEKFKEVFSFGSTNDRVAYIVITSSLGLCGGYNYNIYKLASKEIDKDKDLVIPIGTKGLGYFQRKGYEVDEEFVDLISKYNYQNIQTLRKYVISLLECQKVSKVKIIYTHFKNSITFIPTSEEVFPISRQEDVELTQKEKDMLIEPDVSSVMKQLFPLYLESLISGRIIESNVSEQASRSNSMDSATDNAAEIINKLQIQYNKARQQAITQEITEIVGGANAQQ
jgi:F-type H+-transporting ATPase subunit gamma